MFGYYLDLALRSLKRSPGLTALMVLSIGIGVALAMSSWTLQHLMARNPIPAKSAQLFFPTIDIWGPAARARHSLGNEAPTLLDDGTVEALLRDHRAKRQAAIYWITPTVVPSTPGEHPFYSTGFAVSSEFFPMLDVPFQYGSGWSDADDAARAQVVVISKTLNYKLFGGGDSVGKTMRIRGHDYRVAGVLGDWNPEPVYYDVPAFGGFMLQPTGLFIPFSTANAGKFETNGATACIDPPTAGLTHSNCAWISYMVELDSPAAVRKYKEYLQGFARQRFAWPPNYRLRDLMKWLDFLHVVPDGIKILRLVGMGLLIVCLVDTIGLLLAKFLRRSGEIGIRRALGAQRRAIYAQFLTEATLIGVGGAVIGIPLTWLAMLWMRTKMAVGWYWVTRLDAGLLALTIGVAVLATLLAAVYPVWRAAHVQPAWQLKEN